MAVKSENRSDVSVVVVSNDGYSDVWPGFFELLFRFWPDRPYPLYLISNHCTFPAEQVIPLRVGDDLSWSQTLARGLEGVPSRHVLLMLEDYFLTARADTAYVCRLHDAMVENDAVYLRLLAAPKPERPHAKLADIGFIEKGAAYRTSLQVAFWDRLVLLDLLRKDESAWEFEVKGSRRSDESSGPFLSVSGGVPAIPYRHAVRRGKWLPEAIRYFTPLGITFNTSTRPVASELNLWWQASLVRRWLGRVWKMAIRPRMN
jgi:hypothetical protein